MKLYSDLVEDIKSKEFDYFVGVPDTILSGVFEEFDALVVCNEFTAYCMAFAAKLAGKNPAVFIQNSGFYYTIPAINGICFHYDTYPYTYITNPPGHSHIRNNETVKEVLEAVIDKKYCKLLGNLEGYPEKDRPTCEPKLMTEPGKLINSSYAAMLEKIKGFNEALVISSAGYLNGFVEEQLSKQFPALYLRGGMGGSIPVGIGLAQNTDKDIIVITGDGATLMHYTALSTVNDLALDNLHIYIVINGVLESTGGQKNPSFPLLNIPNVHYVAVNEAIPVEVKKGMTVYDYDELKTNISDYIGLN